MGLFRRAAAVEHPPPDRSLQRRVAELEDDVAALERRFESLRGSVTGALRHRRDLLAGELVEEDLEAELEEIDDHALGAARRFGKGA